MNVVRCNASESSCLIRSFYTSKRTNGAEKRKTLIWLRINAGDMKIIVFFLFSQAQMKRKRENSRTYMWQDWIETFANQRRKRGRERERTRMSKRSCQWKSRVFFLCAHIFRITNDACFTSCVFVAFSLIFVCFSSSKYINFSFSCSCWLFYIIDMDKSTRPVRSRKHSRLVHCVCMCLCIFYHLFTWKKNEHLKFNILKSVSNVYFKSKTKINNNNLLLELVPEIDIGYHLSFRSCWNYNNIGIYF